MPDQDNNSQLNNDIFNAATIIPTNRNNSDQSDENRQFEIAGYGQFREIGRGGMGTVYEALQNSLNRKVFF
jgi:hypothetical protein